MGRPVGRLALSVLPAIHVATFPDVSSSRLSMFKTPRKTAQNLRVLLPVVHVYEKARLYVPL
jgi:hypothetical protein